jgi:hypothetical protein
MQFANRLLLLAASKSCLATDDRGELVERQVKDLGVSEVEHEVPLDAE